MNIKVPTKYYKNFDNMSKGLQHDSKVYFNHTLSNTVILVNIVIYINKK